MFLAALSTIAKLYSQLRCPSTDECVKKMWYIYMMEYYSAINKNKMTLAGKCMESKIIMLSEISQTEKKNIVCFLSYIESRTENNE
jgi:hypothetical protein